MDNSDFKMISFYRLFCDKINMGVKLWFCIIVTLFYNSCQNNTSSEDKAIDTLNNKVVSEMDSLEGYFHGESTTRKENFDSITDVTSDNIEKLYSLYNVKSIRNGEYYIIEPKKLYYNARYFTRVIRMKDNIQVAARTFYDYALKSLFFTGDRILFALNPPIVTTHSYKYSFKCKTVLTDNNFVPLKGQMYSPSKGEYAHIDTIYATPSGFHLEVVDVIFDSGELSRDFIDLDFKNEIAKNHTVNSEFN